MSKNKSLPWFRFYHEFSTDIKVQKMSEPNQRRLVMLFCMRCNVSETLHETFHDTDIAFFLRISEAEWAKTKDVFMQLKFIDSENHVLNWDKRQFKSDSSYQRVIKHRETMKRFRNVTCNGFVTPPETETDTERKKEPPYSPPPKKKIRSPKK